MGLRTTGKEKETAKQVLELRGERKLIYFKEQ